MRVVQVVVGRGLAKQARKVWFWEVARLPAGDALTGFIPGPKFRLRARLGPLNCGGNVGTRTCDFLRDRQADILAVNEALPS